MKNVKAVNGYRLQWGFDTPELRDSFTYKVVRGRSGIQPFPYGRIGIHSLQFYLDVPIKRFIIEHVYSKN